MEGRRCAKALRRGLTCLSRGKGAGFPSALLRGPPRRGPGAATRSISAFCSRVTSTCMQSGPAGMGRSAGVRASFVRTGRSIATA